MAKSSSKITIRSYYKGKELFELPLSYGETNLISPESGTGKTALGLFLKDESDRRLFERGETGHLNSSSRITFIPQLEWEISIAGNIGLVDYLSTENLNQSVLEYLGLESALKETFRQLENSSCLVCQGELIDRDSEDFESLMLESSGSYFMLVLELPVLAEEIFKVLEWIRRHSISRILISDEIVKLPLDSREDGSFVERLFPPGCSSSRFCLLREVVSKESSGDALRQAVGGVVALSEVLFEQLSIKPTPALLIGEIEFKESRKLAAVTRFDLMSRYFCKSCGYNSDLRPDGQVGGFSLREFEQRKLKDLKSVFEEKFPPQWSELYEFDVEEVSLSDLASEISFKLAIELRLFSLTLLEIRDSIVYIDSALSLLGRKYVEKLINMGNCVVFHSTEGVSLARFLPETFARPSSVLDLSSQTTISGRKKISLEPLIVTSGLEQLITELYASLPEARVRNLSSKDFRWANSKCAQCGGIGYGSISIASLAKVAEQCQTCLGTRYQPQIGLIFYQGVSLSQLMEFTLKNARELFLKRPEIASHLTNLIQLGLDNYKLGDELRLMPSRGRLALLKACD